jgi:hypothetical protein
MIPGKEEEPLTYRTEIFGTPVVFIYHGGQYIDILALEETVHCLNVWDSGENRPRSAIYSDPQLERVAREWIDEELTERDWKHGYIAGLVPCDCRKCLRRSL